jgi:hypothetical protein
LTSDSKRSLKADLNGLDVRVDQHQVEDQVGEGHAAGRDAQAGHVGEVGLGGLARRVHLREDHLPLGPNCARQAEIWRCNVRSCPCC